MSLVMRGGQFFLVFVFLVEENQIQKTILSEMRNWSLYVIFYGNSSKYRR